MVAVGGLLAWNNRGERLWGVISGISCLLAITVFLVASFVQTAGEHARALVEDMVRNAERGDTEAILAVIAPDATLHLESLKRPGRPFEQLAGSIRSLERSNRITANTISTLRARTVAPDEALGGC